MNKGIIGIRATPVGTVLEVKNENYTTLLDWSEGVVPWHSYRYSDGPLISRFIVWGREQKYVRYGGDKEYHVGSGYILKPYTLYWRIAAWFKRQLT